MSGRRPMRQSSRYIAVWQERIDRTGEVGRPDWTTIGHGSSASSSPRLMTAQVRPALHEYEPAEGNPQARSHGHPDVAAERS